MTQDFWDGVIFALPLWFLVAFAALRILRCRLIIDRAAKMLLILFLASLSGCASGSACRSMSDWECAQFHQDIEKARVLDRLPIVPMRSPYAVPDRVNLYALANQ